MRDSVGALERDLMAEGRNTEGKRRFCVVVPYTTTIRRNGKFVEREHTAYLTVLAHTFEEAKETAYAELSDSCISAELRKDVFSSAIQEEQIRMATPEEKRKYLRTLI